MALIDNLIDYVESSLQLSGITSTGLSAGVPAIAMVIGPSRSPVSYMDGSSDGTMNIHIMTKAAAEDSSCILCGTIAALLNDLQGKDLLSEPYHVLKCSITNDPNLAYQAENGYVYRAIVEVNYEEMQGG